MTSSPARAGRVRISTVCVLHPNLQSGPPPMRTLLFVAGLMFAALGCQPPCEPVSEVPSSVCHRGADGGTIVAGAPFTLEAYDAAGTCTVAVEDGGRINLLVSGNSCGAANGAGALRALPNPVPCEIPALPAGTYTVASQVPVTFSIPASDAGVMPTCF